MRKSRAETAETRERIVESAAIAFGQHGIEGTSLNDLMSAAGLTHGGFYRHFESKEQLITEACTRGLEAMVAGVREAAGSCPDQGNAGLATIADAFLSNEHRDDRVAGCPFTTIGSELARADPATRRAATQSLLGLVDLVGRQFPGVADEAARARAFGVVASMVGGVILARIADDPSISDEILRDVRQSIGSV